MARCRNCSPWRPTVSKRPPRMRARLASRRAAGGGRGAPPRGGRSSPQALAEVRALLGSRPRQRDLLIEHLHLIQDRYGHLSAAHLAALAQEMKLALTEVYEVATFYSHFDVVKEGEVPPPAVTVRVCDSLSCAMAGAEHLLRELPNRFGPDVRVVRAPCMGACDRAPVCAVGHVQVMRASVAERGRCGRQIDTMRRPIRRPRPSMPIGATTAIGNCRPAWTAPSTREAVIATVSDAGLARPRRRRLPDRAQMVAGARRSRPRG